MRNCTTKEQSERLHAAEFPYSEADVNMQEDGVEKIAPTYPAWTFTRMWKFLPDSLVDGCFLFTKQMRYDLESDEYHIGYYDPQNDNNYIIGSVFSSQEIVDAAVDLMIWWHKRYFPQKYYGTNE